MQSIGLYLASYRLLSLYSEGRLRIALLSAISVISPALMIQSPQHVNISFIVFALLILGELKIYQKSGNLSWRIVLFTVCQYFISVEILLILAFISLLFLPNLKVLLRDSLKLAKKILVILLILLPPTFFMINGPSSVRGKFVDSNLFKNDIYSLFTPPLNNILGHDNLATQWQAQHENGLYLSFMGIIIFLYLILNLRVNKKYILTAVLLEILSLGDTLRINGNESTITLPWKYIGSLKPFENIIPARFSIFAFILILISISQLKKSKYIIVALFVFLITLLPTGQMSGGTADYKITQWSQVGEGTCQQLNHHNVYAVPIAVPGTPNSMDLLARCYKGIRLASGYAIVPSHSLPSNKHAVWSYVNRLDAVIAYMQDPENSYGKFENLSGEELKLGLSRYKVDRVVVLNKFKKIKELFYKELGEPLYRDSQSTIWIVK